jgi:dTDP-4-dehydrorhamnose reductase
MLDSKVLVFGKDGQLGRAFADLFADQSHVILLGRYDCDLTNQEKLTESLEKYQPEIIINASAYTAVDQAEKDFETAFLVNSIAPQIMAKYIQSKYHGVLLHYSTDYVFDGSKKSSYTESDQTNPLGQYGKSKLRGEQAIQKVFENNSNRSSKYYILRTSWVYGEGGNFIKTILRLAQEREQLKVISDQFGVPNSAEWLAEVGWNMINSNSASGIYHAVVEGHTTWYELAKFAVEKAREFGIELKINPEDIQAIPATEYPLPAPRPYNSRMNNQKLKNAFQLDSFPQWQDQVKAYIQRIITN